jgi:hypothetical protein
MRQLLRDTIESFPPHEALAVTEAAEQSEKMVIRGLAQALSEVSQ